MVTVHLSNHKSFEAAPDTTLLDAAQSAGLVLEHSCRSGRCSTCKARVLQGSTLALKSDLSLTPEERAAGWVLTCTTAATSDLQLDIEDLGLPADLRAKTFPCRIDTIERAAPDVVTLALRLPPSATLRYLPGQYIDVLGPGGLKRSYSIANAPQPSGRLELHVRQVEGGAMSTYWFGAAKANDLLRLHGPIGTFFLRDVAGLDLVFLATGTGIAPIKAMLEELSQRPADAQPASVTLYWGGRRQSDLYWTPSFDHLRLRFVPVLSRADEAWAGARGYVQQVLLQEARDLTRTAVYACGSPAMVDAAKSALVQAGLEPRRYHSDAFVSSN